MKEKLIQVLAYRKGLDKATGKPYTYQKHFDHIKVTSALKLFEHLNDVVEAIPEAERWDVHYTCANCHEPKKDKSVPMRLFAYQEMIPFDLDGIDLSKRTEYIKIVGDVLEVDLNKTGIFCSGNGLHFVVALSQPIESGEDLHQLQRYYKALCGKLNVEFFNSGLPGHADPVRLAESATLRLPMTENRKDLDNPIKTYVIQGNVEAQDFYLDRLVDIVEEEQIATSTRAVDTKAVLSGCDFLKKCSNDPESVTEPQWYGMLGILSFIPEVGVNLCHTYSERHSDYSFENTQSKAEQALGFGKPRTCDSISQVFPGCAQCPNYRKVKTPLSIKGEDFIGTETTGFHSMSYDKNGLPSKPVPNFEDLLKYFKRSYTYVVNKNTRQVSVFQGTHWVDYTDIEIDGFSTTHFKPMANNSKRAEFKGLMLSTNLVNDSFFGKDNSGHVNFKNGVLRLSDRQLLPHSPDWGFNYVLPYDFNPHAKCPEFDQMMNNVTLSDPQLQMLILEFIAYSISGVRATYGQKALILTGTGSNGKSTLLNIIKKLVGTDCFSTISLEDMGDANSRYSMVGKLFNICEEVEETELRKGTAIFKSVVTGANLTVKKLYSDVVSMRIDSKLILSCNELPSSKENTYAIYRRMIIVPFRASFKGKVDKFIEDRIGNEMSGIYNRVLEAYDRLIKNEFSFTDSEVAQKALEEFKYNNSIYNQFADNCLAQGTLDDMISPEEIVASYNTWAQANNVAYRPTNVRLMKELKTMGAIPTETQTKRFGDRVKRVYVGVKRIGAVV